MPGKTREEEEAERKRLAQLRRNELAALAQKVRELLKGTATQRQQLEQEYKATPFTFGQQVRQGILGKPIVPQQLPMSQPIRGWQGGVAEWGRPEEPPFPQAAMTTPPAATTATTGPMSLEEARAALDACLANPAGSATGCIGERDRIRLILDMMPKGADGASEYQQRMAAVAEAQLEFARRQHEWTQIMDRLNYSRQQREALLSNMTALTPQVQNMGLGGRYQFNLPPALEEAPKAPIEYTIPSLSEIKNIIEGLFPVKEVP